MSTTFEHPTVGPQGVENLTAQVERLMDAARAQGVEKFDIAAAARARVACTTQNQQAQPLFINNYHGISLSVHQDGRSAQVTADLDKEFVPSDLVSEGLAAARWVDPDPHEGPPEAESQAWEYPDLDLFHDLAQPQEALQEVVALCERAALQADERVVDSFSQAYFTSQALVLGNSNGFLGGYPSTEYQLSAVMTCALQGTTSRSAAYKVRRSLAEIGDVQAVGRRVVEQAVSRLARRALPVSRCPMVFVPEVAETLLHLFIRSISGDAVSRGRSVLAGALGEQVFPDAVTILETPHLPRSLGSVPFDGEGCKVSARTFVKDGYLQAYALDSSSARRLGMRNTCNSSDEYGLARNLAFAPGALSQAQLLAQMGRGVLVTEVGHPCHMDVEKGELRCKAVGFWVENGEILYALKAFNIDVGLREIFSKVLAVGNDCANGGQVSCPSVLLGELPIRHGA